MVSVDSLESGMNIPSGRLWKKDHSNNDEKGKKNLERDGEPPNDIRTGIRDSEIQPVTDHYFTIGAVSGQVGYVNRTPWEAYKFQTRLFHPRYISAVLGSLSLNTPLDMLGLKMCSFHYQRR